jgi:sulfite exporter TauE/SafE
MAGGIAGGIVDGVRRLPYMSSLQLAGYWIANLLLVALGLYLMDAWRGIVVLENAGRFAWRRVQPMTTRLLPMDSAAKAVMLGALWGWLPCGMVYSVLLTAMLTGTVRDGALVMLSFGLGTLPMLFSLGLLGNKLRHGLRRRRVRVAMGMLVLAFGLLGLLRAAGGIKADWFDAVCVSAPHAAGATQ